MTKRSLHNDLGQPRMNRIVVYLVNGGNIDLCTS